MIREFKFEDEMHTTLACVPMAVRRKLDPDGCFSNAYLDRVLGPA